MSESQAVRELRRMAKAIDPTQSSLVKYAEAVIAELKAAKKRILELDDEHDKEIGNFQNQVRDLVIERSGAARF